MLVRLKGNLKVTIDYEKWEVMAFYLEMKTLMKLQFSREIWLHHFFEFVISLKTF